jgi:hypothetical protein
VTKRYKLTKPAERAPDEIWVIYDPQRNILGASRSFSDAIDEAADASGVLPEDVLSFFGEQIAIHGTKGRGVHRYEANGYVLTLAKVRFPEAI